MTSDSNPVDLPVPFPDVPGASAVPAGATGLPRWSSLPLKQRISVGASAFTDLGMRTAVASMITAAVVPLVVTGAGRRGSAGERDTLRFYAELAAQRDPAVSFPAPTVLPRVSSRPANDAACRPEHGTVEDIEFPSSFQPVNAAMRRQWQLFDRNNVVQAQHWRHDDGPRPTLCAIHGFGGASYRLNGRFFTLPWYFRAGYDVLLYTLPFHGLRAERFSPFGGYGYFTRGLSGFAEAMAQAVHDFRSVIDYLRHTGVDRIALTGISLGGYTAALVASVDDRLEAVIPNCPVVALERTFDDWFPVNGFITLGLKVTDIGREALSAALAYHCPLNYAPMVPMERRMIITGLGDRFAPPHQAELLWEHWDRCALHWFPGSHLLHLSKLEYLRLMSGLLHGFMFE